MKNLSKQIDWQKCAGLVPAIIQAASNNEILMLGFMNQEALQKTLKTKQVYFYSRSRKKLWLKGETSKNYLNLVSMQIDCDNDTLLIKVNPSGNTCHTGNYSCFGNEKGKLAILADLFALIEKRKKEMPAKSYTTSLFREGKNKICSKIAEEALEVMQAAKKETKQRLVEESSDLLYHLFVLLADQKISLEDVGEELRKRNSK
ncbi:MAG: bifunctional phosphoribosyl-AMP cyclohydrolase/phosphoribosyl-ATP diphosphatase HisIE [Candidatus Gracilibacteria bacterium]|jgi:phosphoribosyl-ATP pyrophosphohydrolase/phosphoribosyl-AMP cyclohydrolase